MSNEYISLVMLPLAAVVGAAPSFIRPAVRKNDQPDGLSLVPNAQEGCSDSAIAQESLQTMLAVTDAKHAERGMVIVLGNDAFGTDMAPVNPKGMKVVKILAEFLTLHPQRSVLVESYADNAGSVSHNQELSERRASAVRSALQEHGILRGRVSIRGYGEAHPVAPNDGAINRQRNRRVEIIISYGRNKVSSRPFSR